MLNRCLLNVMALIRVGDRFVMNKQSRYKNDQKNAKMNIHV